MFLVVRLTASRKTAERGELIGKQKVEKRDNVSNAKMMNETRKYKAAFFYNFNSSFGYKT